MSQGGLPQQEEQAQRLVITAPLYPRIVTGAVDIPIVTSLGAYLTPGMQQAVTLINGLLIEQAGVRLLISEAFAGKEGATLLELVEAFVADYQVKTAMLVLREGVA